MNESTLMTIKEFSQFTRVQQSTLRYYDEIGLLPPASRGRNNYRYYSSVQIIKLNYITVMVNLGVPLSVIKEMDIHRTPEGILRLLSRQEFILDKQLYKLRAAYSVIHTYIDNIQHGLLAKDGVIRVEELDEANYVLGGVNDFRGKDSFYESFIRFCNEAEEYRIDLNYPVGGYHEDMNTFLKAPGNPDRFFSQDPLGNKIRPKGNYLVGYKQDYYGNFGDIPERMRLYSEEYKLTFKGPVLTLYLLDEISITEHDQYLSCIMAGIDNG